MNKPTTAYYRAYVQHSSNVSCQLKIQPNGLEFTRVLTNEGELGKAQTDAVQNAHNQKPANIEVAKSS